MLLHASRIEIRFHHFTGKRPSAIFPDTDLTKVAKSVTPVDIILSSNLHRLSDENGFYRVWL